MRLRLLILNRTCTYRKNASGSMCSSRKIRKIIYFCNPDGRISHVYGARCKNHPPQNHLYHHPEKYKVACYYKELKRHLEEKKV